VGHLPVFREDGEDINLPMVRKKKVNNGVLRRVSVRGVIFFGTPPTNKDD
jgi:hypothetical protein